MKAIIFNSGIGKRMGEFTKSHHKSMVVLQNGETIFERQIRILSECGIKEFIVTTGPFREQLEQAAAKFSRLTFHFVQNPIYDKTNYIYSMYLARELFDDDVLLLHGDLVFNRGLVEKILRDNAENLGCVNRTLPQPEKDFKARIVESDIREVSINIFDSNCYAFQPLYKLSKSALHRWTQKVVEFIEKGTDGVYAENALNEILDTLTIKAFSYENDYIDEIDNPEDYTRVSSQIRQFDFDEQRIHIGVDSYLKIPEILNACGAKKPMLVCDKSSFDHIFLSQYIADLGIPFIRFDGFSPNPKYDEMEAGVRLFLKEGCDFILSVGGGSAIDTAKNIKLFSVLRQDENYLKQEFRYSPVVHLSIPTTAGTGSESTRFSVLYFEGEKQSIAHDCIMPEYVILAPRLLETLPIYQKKSTLLDAMCQCIEAIWSVNTNEKCRDYAQKGLRLILDNLFSYFRGDKEANENILLAANYSGRAINISQTTAAHAMSYKITSLCGIAHGHAVSVCLPHVWRYMLDHVEDSVNPESFKEALSLLRMIFKQGNDNSVLQVFLDIVRRLDLQKPELKKTSDIDLMIHSVNPTRLKNNPVVLSDQTLKQLYLEIFNRIKVSVIVPVYNVEKYLSRCLDSLVKQTLKEIEIIVVNDGSTDNSQEIITKYANTYPNKIRAFSKPNGGLSDARNYGIEKAQGEYIGFVDSDDYVDIDMFEQLYVKSRDAFADVICCPITYLKERSVDRRFYKGTYRLFNKKVINSPMLLRHANSFAWNKIYNRNFWLENNFWFPKQWFEDSALIYNVLLCANRVDCVNIPFYYYRQERTGAITTKVDDRIFDIFKSTDSIIKFYKDKGVYDNIYAEIQYLCVRHIIARVKLLIDTPNDKIKSEFFKRAYEYLDKNFPDWKSCSFVSPPKNVSIRTKIYTFLWRHKRSLEFYSFSPKWIRRLYGYVYHSLKKLMNFPKRMKAKKRQVVIENRKRASIQANGIPMIALVQKLLKELNVLSFADFGTLLGLIREGHLLAHDMDVDMGVIINHEDDLLKIKMKLERFGFTPWRQYIYGETIVQESYHFSGIKVDLNYYRIDQNSSKTWLFYRAPKVKYRDNERNVVEMQYSPITKFKYFFIDEYDILIPDNAEQLLEEKYGKNWDIPDTGWIYWKSPAATLLDDIGYYIVFHNFKESLFLHNWQQNVKSENTILNTPMVTPYPF